MDPTYADEKRTKKYIDRLYAVADSDYGIPKICPCGGKIKIETSQTETEKRKYFTCNVFENDGLHRRKCWIHGVEEELEILNRKVDEQSRKIRSIELEMLDILKELKNNAQEIVKMKEQN